MSPLHLTFALTLLVDITWTAPRMVFSLYALALGAQPFEIGILYAVLNLFPLLLSWPIGKLSDRIGPRLPLAVAIGSGAVGLVIPYLVHSMAALYVGSALVGLAFAMFLVNVQNLVGVLSAPDKRAANFTTFSLLGATSNLVGPLIGGFSIDHWGHAVACLNIVALSVVAAVLFAAWGRGLPGGTRRKAVVSPPMLEILSNRALWPLLVTSSLVKLGTDLFQFYIPIYGHQIGLSASAVGSVLAVLAASQFIVRFVLPRLIKRLGEEAMLVYAFYSAAAGFVLAPFTGNAVLLGIACFVFGIGMGVGQPITTILLFNKSADGRSGETLGLRLTVNNVVRVTGPLLFGFIASAAGLLSVFLINAVMMGVGAAVSKPKAEGGRRKAEGTDEVNGETGKERREERGERREAKDGRRKTEGERREEEGPRKAQAEERVEERGASRGGAGIGGTAEQGPRSRGCDRGADRARRSNADPCASPGSDPRGSLLRPSTRPACGDATPGGARGGRQDCLERPMICRRPPSSNE